MVELTENDQSTRQAGCQVGEQAGGQDRSDWVKAARPITGVFVTKNACPITVTRSVSNLNIPITVWSNSEKPIDRKVFGRYLAVFRHDAELVYVQDDDCLTDPAMIISSYTESDHSNRRIVSNMPEEYRPEYDRRQCCLVGFGAVFHRDLVASAFMHYFALWPLDELFERECDRVFTGLNQRRYVNVPVQHLPTAHAPDRMWREKRHGNDLNEIMRRVDKVRSLHSWTGCK